MSISALMTTIWSSNVSVLAEFYWTWASPWSTQAWLAIVAVAGLSWMVLRLFWGQVKTKPVFGICVLRTCALLLATIVLLGPTIVDESPGLIMRPSMLYLYDGSQSMKLGDELSRWEESLQFANEAGTIAGLDDTTQIHEFRFGHRLEPLRRKNRNDSRTEPHGLNTVSSRSEEGTNSQSLIDPPTATDTRLADALRELLPQVDSKHTSGVVLLSDGRVRATESVERLAELYGQNGVPLHVVPVGKSSGSGDVAIVSLVASQKVRKYTENQIQVFLRSFGMNGQPATIRLVRRSASQGLQPELRDRGALASVPVTLVDGVQSVTLTYRINDRPEDLVVEIEPIAGELTDRNNRIETRVNIDRTKVRVLYLEGDNETVQTTSLVSEILSLGGLTRRSGLPQTLQTLLQEDEDIDCVLISHLGGGVLQGVNLSNNEPVSFPRTRSELFSFDCIIMSNLSPNVLDDEHSQWIAQWVEGRGGGLIVTGDASLNPDDWKQSKLQSLLPIRFAIGNTSGVNASTINITQPKHSIWRLKLEDELNAKLLSSIPKLMISGVSFDVKPNAEVLAKAADSGIPTMLGQRVGRGRVFLSTAALAGHGLKNFADHWGSRSEQLASKFWRNVVYWATEGSSQGRRRLIANVDKQFYRPGETIHVHAVAYDETALVTTHYRLWGIIEPASLDAGGLFSPILWPEAVPRESGEPGPRIAWGEELPLSREAEGAGYAITLTLSENTGAVDEKLNIELTAYEGSQTAANHGTQVDSTSLSIHILSDPFEQQNPLPNHELLARIASVSGGQVLEKPHQLAELLQSRPKTEGTPKRELTPAWSQTWLWLCFIALLTGEWIWRKVVGMA